MAAHNLLGKEGENMALQWLQQKGYIIMHQNWRSSHYEIDIIATKGEVLHFVEIKTRSNKKFGEPEAAISKEKIRHLLKAGAEYQYQHPGWKRVQYDVLSIAVHKNETPSYFFIEDIYL